jgi:hypothetical protein
MISPVVDQIREAWVKIADANANGKKHCESFSGVKRVYITHNDN